MNRSTEIEGTVEDYGSLASNFTGSIEFRNFSFAYASRPNNPVLRDMSFDSPAGQQTAIVGLPHGGARERGVLCTPVGVAARGGGIDLLARICRSRNFPAEHAIEVSWSHIGRTAHFSGKSV